jgi:hypothetical protein
MAKLGDVQFSLLEALALERRGLWYPGCNWHWDGVTNTVRILATLERRGLVCSSTRDGRTAYTITEAGADEVLARHPNYLDIAYPFAANATRIRAVFIQRKEDIVTDDPGAIYRLAAEALGWRWSDAHAGYISESHRDNPGHEHDGSWQSYKVCEDAEDACFIDGIANPEQAATLLARH